MAGRIVVFGATGFTGALTARALVARGAAPVLAGRRPDALHALAAELGGLETAVADARDPAAVRALVGPGDVLVATAGPFLRVGEPAVRAAVEAGAHYLDSTGEGPFVRRVFERWGPEATRTALVPAFGYDFVPGNLAGALALREAGALATAVDIAYFAPGAGAGSWSAGTRASAAGMVLEPGFAFRHGELVTERAARRVWSVRVGSRERPAVSVAGSEHLALPHAHPQLRDVGVHIGWFGDLARPLQAFSATSAAALAVPGARRLARGVAGALVRGSSGGPDAAARASSGTYVVAAARDRAGGETLSEVRLRGVNAYDLTARLLAWGAQRAADGAVEATGACGPVDAFGLDALEAGCREAGLERAVS